MYIGGGDTARVNDNCIVMAYDISTGQWTKLPPYRALFFAMTVISNQLVLVGGEGRGGDRSKVLGVWRADGSKWTHPYPDMSTARAWCSAAAYKEWLLVTGGYGDGMERLSAVEVMNTDAKQWFAGPPTPVAWTEMKTAIVGNTCYFMGGYINGASTNVTYSTFLPALVAQLTSGRRKSCQSSQIWEETHGNLQFQHAAPVCIKGSLVAVGGRDMELTATTALSLHRPDTHKWVKVGDLPTPRCSCTCVIISEKEMLVVGGSEGGVRVDIATWTC